MVDFGIISEAANGDVTTGPGDIYFQDPNFGTANAANTAYGIPTYYYEGNPWSLGGSDTNSVIGPLSLEYYTQEGVNVGSGTNYVTEDLNGNNLLDTTDAYYEYGIHANWTGWKQVQVPVNFSAADGMNTTTDGTSYFFHTQNPSVANPTIIRTIRLWVTGNTPNVINGDFYIENISFTHNLWALEVEPTANEAQGVTVNTSKFDVDAISQGTNSSFQPTLRFVTVQAGQDQSAILYKEQALEITYNVSNVDFQPKYNPGGLPVYYATRVFSQGLDLTNYLDLRFDLQIRAYRPGDILFIRVGNDQAQLFPIQCSFKLRGGKLPKFLEYGGCYPRWYPRKPKDRGDSLY